MTGTRQSLTPKQLTWLEHELGRWQRQGHLQPEAAQAIRVQYDASRRFSVGRLMLGIGASFVGVGVLWLVAANVEQLSPAVRFLGVLALWLGAVAGAELLVARRGEPDQDEADTVVAAVRLVAALAFGGVVFQAAQSLQVPAYSSGLVGLWGAGALVYAYAAGAIAPLLVGVSASVGWYGWVVTERADSAAGTAVALLLAAVLAAALAVAHGPRRLPRFAAPWRTVSALLALLGLFVAAFPQIDEASIPLPGWMGVAAVLLVATAVAVVSERTGQLEIVAAVTAAGVGLLLLGWQPADVTDASELSGEGLLRAMVAILVYLLAAIWFASLGVLRDAAGVTQVATAGLVLFTVVQSFAVFEPILSGAALFLALGAVLAGTGYLVDRGRRRLVADVLEVQA